MRVSERLSADGRRLFRLRSLMPLVLLVPLFFALKQMARFELRWGEQVEDWWLVFCLSVSTLGLAMRCLTVGFVPAGTSGRGRGAPSAATLNTEGMYSVVRNPLYLANGIMWLGVAMSTASAWFVALTILVYWLYIERVISAEEAFLERQFSERYADWVAHTPCFLPRLSRWRAPDLRFSLRSVLRREYPGLIAIGVAFTLVELVSDTLMEGEPFGRWLVSDRQWVIFFVATVASGLIIRIMKKQHWLDSADR